MTSCCGRRRRGASNKSSRLCVPAGAASAALFHVTPARSMLGRRCDGWAGTERWVPASATRSASVRQWLAAAAAMAAIGTRSPSRKYRYRREYRGEMIKLCPPDPITIGSICGSRPTPTALRAPPPLPMPTPAGWPPSPPAAARRSITRGPATGGPCAPAPGGRTCRGRPPARPGATVR